MKWSIIRDVAVVSLLVVITFQFYSVLDKLSDLNIAITSLRPSSLDGNPTQEESLVNSINKIHDILDAAEVLSPQYGIYKNNDVGQAMGKPVYQRVHSNEIAKEELEKRLYGRN